MPSDLIIFVSPEKAEDPRYVQAQAQHGVLVAHPKFGRNDVQIASHVRDTNIWKLQTDKQFTSEVH